MALDSKEEPLRVVVASPDTTLQQSSQVIDLRDVASALWRGKWIVLLVTLLGLGYGLWKLHKAQPVYEASMIVLPSEDGGGGGLGSTAGAIAQNIGLSIGGEETTLFDRLEITLGSYSLARRLQEKHGLLQIIYEGSWDSTTQSWKRPQGDSFERREAVMAFFNQPQWRPPSLESLADYLGGAIDVSDVGATKVKKLSLQHSDPEMAEYLLRTAYNEAAELVRAQDRQRIELERDYLLRQLGRVSLQLNRDVLIRLLADREQRLMLTDNSEGYLGQVIDPVRVSSRPRPLSTNEYVILPTIIAFLMSALLVTVIFLFRNEGRRS